MSGQIQTNLLGRKVEILGPIELKPEHQEDWEQLQLSGAGDSAPQEWLYKPVRYTGEVVNVYLSESGVWYTVADEEGKLHTEPPSGMRIAQNG